MFNDTLEAKLKKRSLPISRGLLQDLRLKSKSLDLPEVVATVATKIKTKSKTES